MFIDRLKIGALEDCITYYESDMGVILRKFSDGE